MRDRTKLFSFALCALLMLGFASTVQAQVQYTVSSNPNEVVQYGHTELMGELRLASTTCTTIGSTITVTYQGLTITNPSAVPTAVTAGPAPGGINVTATGVFNVATVTYTSVASTGGGGQVIITLPGALGPVAPGDYIAVNGVRADVSTRSVGSDINAALSSSPSNANTFLNASILRVATVNTSLTI